MSERILRGHYRVNGPDGYRRWGPIVAGGRIRIEPDQYLKALECDKPFRLECNGLVVWIVTQAPSLVTFGPFEIARTLDVRRVK